MPPPKASFSRYIKLSKPQNKKIIHKHANRGQSMKHNRISVVQEFEKIKLIGNKIEVS
jgi:hypothetical protein